MINNRIILTVLISGIISQEIHAIKPQTWGLITAGGIVTGATAAGIAYHLSKQDHHEKPRTRIAQYLGACALGGIMGGSFTGILGYFFTPYYRLRQAKNRIDELRNNPLVMHHLNQGNLYQHINRKSPSDQPLAATFDNLTSAKDTLDQAVNYLEKAKSDANGTTLQDVQQTENLATQLQTNTEHHLAYLREHPQFQQQLNRHRNAQREAIRLRNEIKYADAAERGSHAMQTSAHAQLMHGTSDVARTIHHIVRH